MPSKISQCIRYAVEVWGEGGKTFLMLLLFLYRRELCQSALRGDYWTTIDRRHALEKITVADMQNFIDMFYNGVFIEGLVEGNMTPVVRSISM